MSSAGTGERGEHAFERFRAGVTAEVDAVLARWLEERGDAARGCGPDVTAMHDQVSALVLRGGKRLRPVLLAAAYVGCGGAGGASAVAMAGVSLELLQAYLLIHDDWMDGDEVRRGGPSVHAALRERFGSSRAGDIGGILAGDYAAALAQEALFEVPAPGDRLAEAARVLARVQRDVTLGQLLDARASAVDAAAVERMHVLKTASYTVEGPVLLGAALAGAPATVRDGLARFARPLGVAFQLRDDLLGTFGDPATTGKPRGSDLREGKHTALVVELASDTHGRRLLERVLGVDDAPAEEIDALVARMVASGAKARVEARLDARMREAAAALDDLAITEGARDVLRGAIEAMGKRER